MFPWINLFLVFLGIWLALSPRFRKEGDVEGNWKTFKWNMMGAAVNAGLIIIGYMIIP